MSQWPDSLPQSPLVNGYAEEQQENTIRSNNDAGPAKVRNRFTAVAEYFTVKLALTSEQVGTLWGFYRNSLSYGALSFDWQHPRTEDPATCRMMGPPKIAGGDRLFSVSFTLEVLP